MNNLLRVVVLTILAVLIGSVAGLVFVQYIFTGI